MIRGGEMVASEPGKPYEPGYPQWLVDAARWVKAVLQMLVGIYTLFWLVRAFVLSPGMHNCAVINSREQLCYAIPPAAVAFQMGRRARCHSIQRRAGRTICRAYLYRAG
jgi:hypothetical protein